MFFSVEKNNLTYSVLFLPEMMTVIVLQSVTGSFLAQMDLPIQMWLLIKISRIDLTEYHQMPFTSLRINLERRKRCRRLHNKLGWIVPKFLIPDKRLKLWTVSSVNPIIFEEDEVLVRTRMSENSSEWTTESTTGKRGNASFALRWEFAKFFSGSTALWFTNNLSRALGLIFFHLVLL